MIRISSNTLTKIYTLFYSSSHMDLKDIPGMGDSTVKNIAVGAVYLILISAIIGSIAGVDENVDEPNNNGIETEGDSDSIEDSSQTEDADDDGESTQTDDMFAKIADNPNPDDREEVIEAVDRVLESHDIEVNDENRERVARMALETRNQKENYNSWLAVVCMWNEPPRGAEWSGKWDKVETVAEACAS
jgi:hypothetical protein